MIAVNLDRHVPRDPRRRAAHEGARRGRIINISSTAGQRGESFHAHYAATKGAMISLTKSLAVELAPFGILVNCVAPGWVDTDMTRDDLMGARGESILADDPARRAPGTPEEIAAAPWLFLASGPGHAS